MAHDRKRYILFRQMISQAPHIMAVLRRMKPTFLMPQRHYMNWEPTYDSP